MVCQNAKKPEIIRLFLEAVAASAVDGVAGASGWVGIVRL